MSIPSFPVLRLPAKTLRATLQHFAIIDLLSFSLISPNSVRSLNIQAANVLLILDDLEMIHVRAADTLCAFYLKPEQKLRFSCGMECRWLNGNFSLEKTLKNFLAALNLLKVKNVLVTRSHAACDNLTGIKFKSVVMLRKNRPMFDLFYRYSDSLALYDRALLDQQTRAIFSENMNSLVLVPPFVVDLNDLLVINAIKVKICCPFTLSNLNLFLRHFINGSHPRLKETCIALEWTNLDDFKTTLLNGINYWTTSLSKTYDDGRAIDGVGFMRIDGVEVTIFVDLRRRRFELIC